MKDVKAYCISDKTTKLTLHTHDLYEIHIERFFPKYKHNMMCIGVEDAKKMRDWLDAMIKEEEGKKR